MKNHKKLLMGGALAMAVVSVVACTHLDSTSKTPAASGAPAGQVTQAAAPAAKPAATVAEAKPAVPGVPALQLGASAPAGLKDGFLGKFLIGTAGDMGNNYSAADRENIKANYNVITPENCMKPQPLHPTENQYTWGTADNMVKWCTDNNIKVWGHTLAWHGQTPAWFFQAPANGGSLHDAVLERLHQHILAVAGHFKGQVMGWDVVNEAINDNPGGLNGAENLRRSGWSTNAGPEFITMAFKWAHEADPKARLNYNDYNIEQGATAGNGKHAASMALLKRLIADGAPITGVGIQGHWHLDTNLADVEKAITDYQSLGLKVSISELDVTAVGQNSGAMPGGGGAAGQATEESFKRQAEVYGKLFDIFNRHAAAMERVTLWGISDRRSWRANQSPLVFDAQLRPKPAYYSIMDVAAGKPLVKP